MLKRILVLAAVLLVQACSYAISPDIVSHTDRNLTLRIIQDNPDASTGKTVILGGTITQTLPAKNGGTLIEIKEHHLDCWGKPKRTKTTDGSFVVLHPGYLNALVYEAGREITVAGTVEKAGSNADAEAACAGCVLIKSIQLKLWPDERPTWSTPKWIDPLYDPSGADRHN
jgi:outer membrane lipoprotein